MKAKEWEFIVEKNGERYIRSVTSKTLTGAVRKLYQMYEFAEIKKILS